MPLRNVEDDFRTELVRKTIHLTGLLVPGIYYFVERRTGLIVMIPLTLFAILIELGRHRWRSFGTWFHRWFGPILRKKERPEGGRTLHAAVWFMIVSTALVAFFPKYVTIVTITVWVFGDGVAALVGRRFGRHHVGNRTLEGTAAFIVAALLVVAATPRVEGLAGEYVICAAAGVVGAVVELLSRDPIEDNLSVPLAIAGTLWVLYAWWYPEIALYDFGA